MLETSKKCVKLLENFLDTLEQIQEGVKSLDSGSFCCFPFGYNDGNITCASSNSPICEICRGLHEYDLVAEWREDLP